MDRSPASVRRPAQNYFMDPDAQTSDRRAAIFPDLDREALHIIHETMQAIGLRVRIHEVDLSPSQAGEGRLHPGQAELRRVSLHDRRWLRDAAPWRVVTRCDALDEATKRSWRQRAPGVLSHWPNCKRIIDVSPLTGGACPRRRAAVAGDVARRERLLHDGVRSDAGRCRPSVTTSAFLLT